MASCDVAVGMQKDWNQLELRILAAVFRVDFVMSTKSVIASAGDTRNDG